jgi:hypothetical protein
MYVILHIIVQPIRSSLTKTELQPAHLVLLSQHWFDSTGMGLQDFLGSNEAMDGASRDCESPLQESNGAPLSQGDFMDSLRNVSTTVLKPLATRLIS